MAPAVRKVLGSPTYLDEVAVLLALAVARAMGRLGPASLKKVRLDWAGKQSVC